MFHFNVMLSYHELACRGTELSLGDQAYHHRCMHQAPYSGVDGLVHTEKLGHWWLEGICARL